MPFQPGNNANPKGRPTRKNSMTEQIRRYSEMPYAELRALAQKIKDGKDKGIPSLEVIAIKFVLDSCAGDGIRKEMLNRLDGRVPLPIVSEHENDVTRALDDIISREAWIAAKDKDGSDK